MSISAQAPTVSVIVAGWPTIGGFGAMVRLIVKSDGSVGVGSQRNGPHAASMLLRQDTVVGDDAPSDDGAVVAGGVSTVVVSRTVVESAVSSAKGTDADTDL